MSKKKIEWKNVVLVLAGIICIGVALNGLFGIYKDYKTSDDIYEKATEEFVEINLPDENSSEIPWYELIRVDISRMQEKNSDVVGWIFFEDGSISYPIVQGVDNDQYLHTTYDGIEAKAGSIFMEASDSSDFSDTHTLIYGHNMRNLSMFGKLKYYKTKEGYYDEHKYFQILKENEILRYQIFSYQEVPEDSYVYFENFTSAEELAKLLQPNSMINAKLDIMPEDKIITLSTCTAMDDERFIVSAVLVETYNLNGEKQTEE